MAFGTPFWGWVPPLVPASSRRWRFSISRASSPYSQQLPAEPSASLKICVSQRFLRKTAFLSWGWRKRKENRLPSTPDLELTSPNARKFSHSGFLLAFSYLSPGFSVLAGSWVWFPAGIFGHPSSPRWNTPRCLLFSFWWFAIYVILCVCKHIYIYFPFLFAEIRL